MHFRIDPTLDKLKREEIETSKQVLSKIEKSNFKGSAVADLVSGDAEQSNIYLDFAKSQSRFIKGISLVLALFGVAFHFALRDALKKAGVK